MHKNYISRLMFCFIFLQQPNTEHRLSQCGIFLRRFGMEFLWEVVGGLVGRGVDELSLQSKDQLEQLSIPRKLD